MKKTNLSLFIFCCLLGVVYAYDTNSKLDGRKAFHTWCIVKPDVPVDKLQGFINYACGIVNCAAIQVGGACFYPNTITSHASYALDLVYASRSTCNPEIGTTIGVDPSYGNCKYP
ncbi:Glucan endo-1,3-beta-D-glucosidase [Handroanthus impetiginosus]|uniref:Glucan endo-1,3-beta-D-glucosidase n=1 Tax=Handroanthus impetiginosus TaxID=429701 RepID=A0A2G9G9L0_9LAMI|nr:Glucan endo-1,3-beta-D-glucosidase [Handroanthus impetiginosus]